MRCWRGVVLSLFFGLAAAGGIFGQDDGKEAFIAGKCERCHAISRVGVEATTTSERMLGPDLSEVGSRHDAEWIRWYLRKEVEFEDKAHRTEWKGTKDDLERIATWLAGLNGS